MPYLGTVHSCNILRGNSPFKVIVVLLVGTFSPGVISHVLYRASLIGIPPVFRSFLHGNPVRFTDL